MRIGQAREPFDQQLSLHDWCNETGNGIIGYYSPHELPDGAIDFVYAQYERFGVPVLKDRKLMDKIIRVGAWASYYVIDVFDPYIMLTRGVSDITWSDVGHTHTIDIKCHWDKNRPSEEADPEKLEAFVPAPGQAENFFNYAMARPGLEALPSGIGEEIQMCLFDTYGGPEEYCDSDAIEALQELCLTGPDTLDRVRYNAYFELAAWASFLWFVGPPGKDWRVSSHDAFWLCETEGMALIYDLCFLTKEYYTIHQRTPQSCCVCGLDSYCVELAHVDGMTRFVCEKHLNPEPLYGGATCGSKVCKFAVCPHHPLHGQQDAMHRMLSGSGQIVQINHQKRDGMPAIASRQSQRLIANK